MLDVKESAAEISRQLGEIAQPVVGNGALGALDYTRAATEIICVLDVRTIGP